MHQPESVREIETYEIPEDFEVQTDHLIPAKRPDHVPKKKKKNK